MAEGADRLVAGRYRLIARLGQGGMGVVWRAHDELLRRDVAVKELHVRLRYRDPADPDTPDGEEDLPARRVLREARAAAALRHPGVVAVHDVVVDGGRPLIVMELVDGPSLAQVVRTEGPLPETRVAVLGSRLLRALEAAHRRGIVHRDVKPANILLDGDRVVLTDFGIAATAGDTTLTEAGAVLGSPEYLAPERVNGEGASPATDLWSLGVTLCAALRGVSPFQRADTQATLAAVLTYQPPPIPHAPRLWPLLAALLSKDPSARPTTAAAAAALAAIADADPEPHDSVTVPVTSAETRPVASGPRGRSWRTRAALLGVVVLVAAVATVALVVRPWHDDARDTPPAPPGFTVHQGDGFTIAVPRGWRKEETGHDVAWLSGRDPGNGLLAHVEWWDDGEPGDARELLAEFEKTDFTMDFITGYQRLRLAAAPERAGMTRAELEVTYHLSMEGEFATHDLMHAVVTDGGRTYVLAISAQTAQPASTEELWRANEDVVRTIVDSFRVTP